VIRLFDSLKSEVRPLTLREPGKVSMYVCGPTVYGLPHMGHGRFTLVWDVFRRWLTFQGYEVTFVSNITDIDDKIINLATSENTTEELIADRYEQEWWKAMAKIGVARPTHSPLATHYVSQMVSFIEALAEKDIAYPLSDGMYFDTSRVSDYGALAGQSLDTLRSGARVETLHEKRSPLDFALWKKAKEGEPSWPAPFGEGRPGWHTECVVMSLGLLRDGFDLHCGGLDLKFPHHENERAQAVAAGHSFAQHWAHNGFVMVEGEKMSKSLGNFTSLTDLLERTDARAYRLLVLRSHYRSPIEVTAATIEDAERALERLDSLARRFNLESLAGDQFVSATGLVTEGASGALATKVTEYLDDDLNTPLAVATLFEALSQAHTLADEGQLGSAQDLAESINTLFGALGLTLKGQSDEIDPESAEVVRLRDEARANRDWAEADRFRDLLVNKGWIVEDSPSGTVIRR
jgi:cysteinyl-tRNA synthetase